MNMHRHPKSHSFIVVLAGMLLAVCVVGCSTTGQYSIDKNYTLGRKYYEAGRYQKAIEYYLQHTGDHPDSLLNEVVFYHLGRSYQQLEDYKNARTYYQRLMDKYKGGFWADLASKEMSRIPAK